MRYPILIEPGDDTHAFGVVVPDLPGCFSAGDTLEEAVESWIECAVEEGLEIPKPSAPAEVSKLPEYQGWILAEVDVDLSKLSGKAERDDALLPKRS